MATYVLVHGAWSGPHTFRKVRPLLAKAGHAVFTPGLTGLGERSHLASPLVNLTTHVRDVVNLVLYEDLSGIVLLGYSYGGMVVTGALEHIADRVQHLVYLDAFVPGGGQSLYGLSGRPASPAVELGGEWLVSPMPRQFDDSEEAAWATARRSPHPIGCFVEPVRLQQPLEAYPFSRTYIKATGEPRGEGGGGHFWEAGDRAKASPAWRYREVDTNHMIPNNRPEELTQLLLELA
jgi:pimeloyl-ACP methyl ester carboxylesterase